MAASMEVVIDECMSAKEGLGLLLRLEPLHLSFPAPCRSM
jgi:hypothetical protein